MQPTLESRLATLEGSHRRARLLNITLAATLGAAMVMGFGSGGVSDVVRTRKLEVINQNGIPVIEAWAADDGGMIQIDYSTGKTAVNIDAGDYPGMSIYNKMGRMRCNVAPSSGAAGDAGAIVIYSQDDGKPIWYAP